MARLSKKGLLYFNIDCIQEDNLNFIEAKHGIVGYGVVVKIWKKIYQLHGYYCEWSERNIYLFAREINVEVSIIEKIVETCFEEKIFSRELFNESQVLTSSGVQKRWKKIVIEAKRKDTDIETKYALLPKILEGMQLIPEKCPNPTEEIVQSKINEIKENEINERKGQDRSRDSIAFTNKVDLREEETSVSMTVNAIYLDKNKKGQCNDNHLRPGSIETQNYFIQTTQSFWDQAVARSQANLFLSYYEANGWVQSKSKPIINWKAAAYGWIQRELNGNFKVQRSNTLDKTAIFQETFKVNFIDKANVKTDLDYLYTTFLDGKLKFEQIDVGYYDYLKNNKLINFSDYTLSQIKEQARKSRMELLIGTNQAKFIRIYQAYEAKLPVKFQDIRYIFLSLRNLEYGKVKAHINRCLF